MTETTLPTDSEYAAAARRLAARLVLLAEPGTDGAPTWSGDDVDPIRSTDDQTMLVHGHLDDGLLTGRAGIAVALAVTARLPGGRPEWTSCARTAIWSAARAALATATPPSGELGWCSGWLGIARGAGLVADWTQDRDLAVIARALAGRGVTALADDPGRCPDYPDLLDGLAGHLTAALAADLEPGAEPARRAAAVGLLHRLLGHATVATGRAPASSVSWPMAGTERPVIGLAHGGSGITLALAAAAASGLSARHGFPRLGELIMRTRRWEDEHFRAEAGGWPDLRAAVDVPGLAWCHGAPGVGIAAAYRALADPDRDTAETFARARTSVQRYQPPTGTAFDGTLCHGLSGMIELHLLGAQAWPAAGREHLAEARLLARHLTRAGRPGWPGWTCGVRGGRTPVLLTGLAGVAYTLVRCHDPALAPSLAHPGLPARSLAAAAG